MQLQTKKKLLQLLTNSGKVLFFGTEYAPPLTEEQAHKINLPAMMGTYSSKSDIGDILCFELNPVDEDVSIKVISKVQMPAFVINTGSTETDIGKKFSHFFAGKVFTITDGKLEELEKKEIDQIFKL